MCYTVPMVGAAITSIAYHRKKNVKVWWLNLMFYGGALFGIIDHIWNGEIFLISKNLMSDLLLGVVISVAILTFWWLLIKITPIVNHTVNLNRTPIGS